MSDRFTGELWRGIADIYGAILAHPFLTGLTDGSLPHDAFAFYVVQDALYLQRYAEALAAVASRAPDTAGTEMFARHAAGVVAVEQKLHDSLLASLGIDPASADMAEPAPTTLAYTSYLLATIRRRVVCRRGRRRAAVLLDLLGGRQGAGAQRLTRPALPAMDRYLRRRANSAMSSSEVLAVADGLGAGLATSERARVRRHFRTTSRYEWMFWDMGYRKESWPL